MSHIMFKPIVHFQLLLDIDNCLFKGIDCTNLTQAEIEARAYTCEMNEAIIEYVKAWCAEFKPSRVLVVTGHKQSQKELTYMQISNVYDTNKVEFVFYPDELDYTPIAKYNNWKIDTDIFEINKHPEFIPVILEDSWPIASEVYIQTQRLKPMVLLVVDNSRIIEIEQNCLLI